MKVLRAEVETWNFARGIREYVADARARMDTSTFAKNIEGGIPFEEWLTWATSYADRIDPLRVDDPADDKPE